VPGQSHGDVRGCPQGIKELLLAEEFPIKKPRKHTRPPIGMIPPVNVSRFPLRDFGDILPPFGHATHVVPKGGGV
jgi:hypothetical protein